MPHRLKGKVTDYGDLLHVEQWVVKDNGDNTATAAAVGTLGVANIHMLVNSDLGVSEGDLQIIVVAGLAERVQVVAGEPEEVTSDI